MVRGVRGVRGVREVVDGSLPLLGEWAQSNSDTLVSRVASKMGYPIEDQQHKFTEMLSYYSMSLILN